MAGPSASSASRAPTYSGTTCASLRRPRCRFARLRALVVAVSLGLCGSGCAMSNMFGFGKDDAMARADVTGSIQPAGKLSNGMPPEADLIHTRAAITEVLSIGRKDFSTAWENPKTGARGTVTPIAKAYSHDGQTCHDFLASYINGRTETWMRGEACQQTKGRWEVKVLRPWTRS